MQRDATALSARSPGPAATLTALAGAWVLAMALFCLVNAAAFALATYLAVPAILLFLVTGLAFGDATRQRLGLVLLWAQFGMLLGLMLTTLFRFGGLLLVPMVLTGFALVAWPRGADEPFVTPLALALHVLAFAGVVAGVFLTWSGQ